MRMLFSYKRDTSEKYKVNSFFGASAGWFGMMWNRDTCMNRMNQTFLCNSGCTEYSGCVAVIYSAKATCKQISSNAHYAEDDYLHPPRDNWPVLLLRLPPQDHGRCFYPFTHSLSPIHRHSISFSFVFYTQPYRDIWVIADTKTLQRLDVCVCVE